MWTHSKLVDVFHDSDELGLSTGVFWLRGWMSHIFFFQSPFSFSNLLMSRYSTLCCYLLAYPTLYASHREYMSLNLCCLIQLKHNLTLTQLHKVKRSFRSIPGHRAYHMLKYEHSSNDMLGKQSRGKIYAICTFYFRIQKLMSRGDTTLC